MVIQWRGKSTKLKGPQREALQLRNNSNLPCSKISVNDITMVLLEVIESGTKIEEFYATDITPTMTPTFEVDLTDYSGKSLTFLTDGKNETFDTLAFATVDITPFPHFPGNTATQNLFDPRDTDKKKILLRVDGSLGDMLLEAGEALS
ncbi:uncharacterized protein LOC135212517 isoform X2 [Macrobrachium nipponense]|uniref:uncharacterized protein LOC135212517 isoform X2 n=1 Tax=Macrobrachium nipponense TaxID=159736 RepID=UPI0030C87FA5